MTKTEKYLDIALITLFTVVMLIGFSKGFLHAFETFPDRIAIFVTQFGK
ncbi:hypothetical protein [Paenibacillus lactis]